MVMFHVSWRAGIYSEDSSEAKAAEKHSVAQEFGGITKSIGHPPMGFQGMPSLTLPWCLLIKLPIVE